MTTPICSQKEEEHVILCLCSIRWCARSLVDRHMHTCGRLTLWLTDNAIKCFTAGKCGRFDRSPVGWLAVGEEQNGSSGMLIYWGAELISHRFILWFNRNGTVLFKFILTINSGINPITRKNNCGSEIRVPNWSGNNLRRMVFYFALLQSFNSFHFDGGNGDKFPVFKSPASIIICNMLLIWWWH